jgi:hypothetical protein
MNRRLRIPDPGVFVATVDFSQSSPRSEGIPGPCLRHGNPGTAKVSACSFFDPSGAATVFSLEVVPEHRCSGIGASSLAAERRVTFDGPAAVWWGKIDPERRKCRGREWVKVKGRWLDGAFP